MPFVLNNSVVMRWALKDREPEVMAYAGPILELLSNGDTAHVPNLWGLRLQMFSLAPEKKPNFRCENDTIFGSGKRLEIRVDRLTHDQALGATLRLAVTYDVSSYDAVYLELAMLLGLPGATVDASLIEALPKARVKAA